MNGTVGTIPMIHLLMRNGKPKLTNGKRLLKEQRIPMKEPIIEKNGTSLEDGNIHVNDVEKRITIHISYASNVIK